MVSLTTLSPTFHLGTRARKKKKKKKKMTPVSAASSAPTNATLYPLEGIPRRSSSGARPTPSPPPPPMPEPDRQQFLLDEDEPAQTPDVLKRTSSSASLTQGDVEYKVTSFVGFKKEADTEDMRREIFQISDVLSVKVAVDAFGGNELRPALVKEYRTREGAKKDFSIFIPFNSVLPLIMSLTIIMGKRNPDQLGELTQASEFLDAFTHDQLRILVATCNKRLGVTNKKQRRG